MRGAFACLFAGGFAVTMSTCVQAQQSDPAGTYCLAGVREVGSCFRLHPDQRFEYFLAYGALDEQSQGTWRLDGSDILLDSPAYDRKPGFVFKEFRAARGDGLEIIVEGPNGNGLAGIDVRVRCTAADPERTGYTQSYGYALPCPARPVAVALGMRMYGVPFMPVQLPEPSATDKAYVLTFEPGDLGRRAFSGVRLTRDGDALIMTYRDTPAPELDGKIFRYRRQ